jgi:hypothetical protein
VTRHGDGRRPRARTALKYGLAGTACGRILGVMARRRRGLGWPAGLVMRAGPAGVITATSSAGQVMVPHCRSTVNWSLENRLAAFRREGCAVAEPRGLVGTGATPPGRGITSSAHDRSRAQIVILTCKCSWLTVTDLVKCRSI